MRRMARFLGLLIIISAFLAPLSVRAEEKESSPPLSLYAPEIQEIINRGYLIVAVVARDNPPFHMTGEKGELVGFDADMAHEIAKELGVKVVFDRSARTFDAVVDLVAANKADLGISKLSFTLERSKKVVYSVPYAILRKGMLINRLKYAQIKKARKADTLEELFSAKDASLAVIDKSSYVPFAERLFTKAYVKPLEAWETDILNGVLKGDVVAAFRDELETKKFLLIKPEANLQLMSIVLKDQEDPIRMIAPLEKKNLLNWVNGLISSGGHVSSVDKLLSQDGPYYKYIEKSFKDAYESD